MMAAAICAAAVLAGGCERDATEGKGRRAQRGAARFAVGSRYDLTVVSRGQKYTRVNFAIEVRNIGTAAGTPMLSCTTIVDELNYAIAMEPHRIAPSESSLVDGGAIVPSELSDAELDDLEPRCRVEPS